MATVADRPPCPTEHAEWLPNALVDQISSWQALSEPALSVMCVVERHLLLPDACLEQAYADATIITRRDQNRTPTSSATTRLLVGRTLGQLELRHDIRVQAVGVGTGRSAGRARRRGWSGDHRWRTHPTWPVRTARRWQRRANGACATVTGMCIDKRSSQG